MAIRTLLYEIIIPSDEVTDSVYTIMRGGIYRPRWEDVISLETLMAPAGDDANDSNQAHCLTVTQVNRGEAWGDSFGLSGWLEDDIYNPIDILWGYQDNYNASTEVAAFSAEVTDLTQHLDGGLSVTYDVASDQSSSIYVVHRMLVEI